ncbi:MAG: AAA family ATPase [Abditibacteriota bacterium]|nr:AAA family ATPase [Abditibacteriota bacterium]
MDNNHIRIGWDEYGEDLPEKYDEGGKNVLDSFYNKMKKGDLVLSCYSYSTIDAIGVIDGECEWHDNYSKYKRLRKVRWLVKGINENITRLNNGKSMTPSTVYKMSIPAEDVLQIVKRHTKGTEKDSEADNKKNYVFIIDEINRGNISKIFGELITLIEENKRAGAKEEMSVTLPYSGDPFSIPDNVYILGTMNTADRSIALLDTALRRRFNFIEMMPEPNLLEKDNVGNDLIIEGCNIKTMFETINKRIEYLLDRDHTLGHSYFWDLKKSKNQTVGNLKKIFENSVIPLLQEYFYDDFEKIQLVLNDKIIKIEDFDKGLFKGNSDIIEGKKLYKIDTDALNKIDSYIKIYESKTKTDDGAKVDGE